MDVVSLVASPDSMVIRAQRSVVLSVMAARAMRVSECFISKRLCSKIA